MDIVYVQDLEIKALIGVLDWERQRKQKLIVNIEMATDFNAAAHSDALTDAVDYAHAANLVVTLTETSTYTLLESLAVAMADELLGNLAITGVRVDLCKPSIIPNCRGVGVRIHRGREF